MSVYEELFRLSYEDTREPAARLKSAVEAIHRARPRHQWTGVYLLRGEVLDLGASVGPETEHKRISIGQGLCGKAVTEKRDLDVGDVNSAPGYLACSIATKSEAIALIWRKGAIVGQIDIDSDTQGEFGKDAMQSLAKMAELLAPLAAELVQ